GQGVCAESAHSHFGAATSLPERPDAARHLQTSPADRGTAFALRDRLTAVDVWRVRSLHLVEDDHTQMPELKNLEATHGSRRVNATKREPIGSGEDRACTRSSRHVFRSRCRGT